MQSISLAIITFILAFFLPQAAYGWGPATHLQFSLEILNNLALIAPPIAAIIGKHRNDFLYGSISADIILGKKFMIEYLHHCHNWTVGHKILSGAKTEGQAACAYGYLSHLAADVISHNYYVPIQLIKSFDTRIHKHAYWEIRYDATIPHHIWTLANKLAKEHYESNDNLLEKMLKRTIFPFKFNKRIFNHLLLLQEIKQWRKTVDSLASFSTKRLLHKDIDDFKNLSVDNMFSFLLDPSKARCCGADPSGGQRLVYAKEARKKLKIIKKQKSLSDYHIHHIIREFNLILRQAIHDNKELPPVDDIIS
jgi:hypothetical protein